MLDLRQIGVGLEDYLRAPLSGLRVLASGWETTVFEFAIAKASATVPSISCGRPMVLRFYQGPLADEKGAREHRAIEALAKANYCVPHPYAYERDRARLGAPFMVMDRVEGGPLFATRSFPQAFKTFSLGFFSFVRAQAQLHRMDPKDAALADLPRSFGAQDGVAPAPLLDRVLATIADLVERG